MKFMNQARFYGRQYREEAAAEGESAGGGEASDNGEQSNEADQASKIKAQLDAMQAENARLQAKINEANKHNREAQKEAERQAREKAEAEGNYEQLFKSSEQERENLRQQLETLQQQNSQKAINEKALKIATNLADGANVELLSEFIARRLKYTDEGIKVVDESGNLTISTIDDLQKEFAGSARYASLIKGNQSSGGGASGGSNSSSATGNTMSRADFDALDPTSQMKFIRQDKGKVVDN